MLENYNEIIAALLERISVLERELAETRKLLAEKDAVIAAQSARIKELEERLGKNSQNSSKPPSSDGYSKPRPVSNREKTGRKAGAQPGHQGHGLNMPKPDVIEDVAHLPEECAGCPHFGTCPKVATSSVRNEIDVEIKVVLKRHYTESYACAKEAGKVVSGSFPEGIKSGIQYGAGVKALAATLNTEGMMSVARVHDFLSAALGLPICVGTVSATVKELAFRVGGTIGAVVEALMASPVNNADETGFRVEGSLYWLHSVCNADFTYLAVQKKRGEEGMRAIGFLPEYQGVVVSDCLGAYWKFDNLSHAICNAHILRELKGIHESDPKQAWAEDMRSLLREMAHARNEAVRADAPALPPETVLAFRTRYDAILEQAAAKNPLPVRQPGQRGRPAKGPVRCLIDRLTAHRDEALLFLEDFRIPFTNNRAEQSLRMAKVKGKVSGCMRTLSGADDFATIMSFIGSVKKHGINVFSAVKDAFLGKAYGVLFPAPTE